MTVDSYAIKTNLKTAQNLATSIYHIGAMNLYIVKVQNGYFEDYICLLLIDHKHIDFNHKLKGITGLTRKIYSSVVTYNTP